MYKKIIRYTFVSLVHEIGDWGIWLFGYLGLRAPRPIKSPNHQPPTTIMQKLTKAEEDVMQLLWEVGRGTVSDLLERCPEPKPPHSTISSVVRILEKKGFVGHKAYGKTHEYFPLVEREAYGRRSLGDLLRNYFGGSVPRLVSHLAEEEKLSKTELEEMMRLLESDNDQKS